MPGNLTKFQTYFGIGAVPGFHGRAAGDQSHYFAELLGLRGIGILIVVIGHLLERVDRFTLDKDETTLTRVLFYIFATPFTGCCLLFCISGYTLALSFKRAGNLSVHESLFYILRRFIRLWAPYMVVLASTFAFLSVTDYRPSFTNQYYMPPTSLAISLFASLTFTHDILFGTFPRLFPPGWFLETMFQFYIVVPWILRLYFQIPKNKNRLLIGKLGLVIATVLALLNQQYGLREMQYSIVSFLPYFWTGVVLADARHTRDGYPIPCALRNIPSVGWLALTAFVVVGAPFDNAILRLATRLICLILIFSALSLSTTNFQRVMAGRWLTRIGVGSYAILLVHLQVLQVVIPLIVDYLDLANILIAVIYCGVLAIPAVMLVATGFYWIVERPFVAAAQFFVIRPKSL